MGKFVSTTWTSRGFKISRLGVGEEAFVSMM